MTHTGSQVWFITGANLGLGAAIAKEVLAKGHKVDAVALKLEGIEKKLKNSPNLMITSLDISSEEQVRSTINEALKHFGQIDVLVSQYLKGSLAKFEYWRESDSDLI